LTTEPDHRVQDGTAEHPDRPPRSCHLLLAMAAKPAPSWAVTPVRMAGRPHPRSWIVALSVTD